MNARAPRAGLPRDPPHCGQSRAALGQDDLYYRRVSGGWWATPSGPYSPRAAPRFARLRMFSNSSRALLSTSQEEAASTSCWSSPGPTRVIPCPTARSTSDWVVGAGVNTIAATIASDPSVTASSCIACAARRIFPQASIACTLREWRFSSRLLRLLPRDPGVAQLPAGLHTRLPAGPGGP